jgi:nucleotide-binding universal stress UspA family protein
MTYRAILVHAEADPAAEPRLKLAAQLANDFEAVLIGAAAETFDPAGFGSSYANVSGDLVEAEAKAVREDLEMAERRFRAVAEQVRAGAEWRSYPDLPAEMLARQSRAADLIVAGPRRNEPLGFHNRADPGDLIMKAGRPVLIAPLAMDTLDASSIVVAWKDTRESRRAVSDALPFLERARQVLIVEVCEDKDEVSARIRVQDVADHLGRHGIKASTAVRAHGGGVAEAILDAAKMQDAGLIVAGGYGHARMREWIFGGVTRDLLNQNKRAVLLSH